MTRGTEINKAGVGAGVERSSGWEGGPSSSDSKLCLRYRLVSARLVRPFQGFKTSFGTMVWSRPAKCISGCSPLALDQALMRLIGYFGLSGFATIRIVESMCLKGALLLTRCCAIDKAMWLLSLFFTYIAVCFLEQEISERR